MSAFVHFSITTYTGSQAGTQNASAFAPNPATLNVSQWACHFTTTANLTSCRSAAVPWHTYLKNATVPFGFVHEDGFLAKILLGDGESAEPDAPIAVICEEQSDVDAFRDYRADGPVEPATFAWQGFLKDPAGSKEGFGQARHFDED